MDRQRRDGRCAAHGRKLIYSGHDKRRDHTDSPDALVMMSVEVKERTLEFTSPEDFPYDDVIVDDLRGMGRETLRHFAYVYVSKPTGKWVWLTTLDRDESWREDKKFDRARGHDVPVLMAPKSHLRPADQLEQLLYPHKLLDVVDGDCGLFVAGGGQVERRAGAHAPAGGKAPSGERGAEEANRQRLG